MVQMRRSAVAAGGGAVGRVRLTGESTSRWRLVAGSSVGVEEKRSPNWPSERLDSGAGAGLGVRAGFDLSHRLASVAGVEFSSFSAISDESRTSSRGMRGVGLFG